jgi:signal transduction histidine kinase
MDVKHFENRTRRDFNNAMTIVGLSSTWVFVYLLVSEGDPLQALRDERGLVLFLTMNLLLIGLIISRKILWAVIERLFDFNIENTRLQKELLEKSRLAAITETALALSHAINNPLMIIRGNLDTLEYNTQKGDMPEETKQKIEKLKSSADRIKEITEKLTTLSKPVTTEVYGDTKMIDPDRSEQKKDKLL